jgi:two-component system, cell cycle response regulator DivK
MNPILIVEDNERNLKLVRDLLQAKGYATLEAGTAEEGLKLAREHAPALILMDIHLPGMSGIDALRTLRAEAATAAIPVIAITASVMKESVREVMAAGFNAFIEKPIDVRGFLEKVRGVVGEGGK